MIIEEGPGTGEKNRLRDKLEDLVSDINPEGSYKYISEEEVKDITDQLEQLLNKEINKRLAIQNKRLNEAFEKQMKRELETLRRSSESNP